MADTTAETDLGFGLATALGLLAALAAVAMYLGSTNQLLAGWAFGAAVVAGSLAIVALHVFE